MIEFKLKEEVRWIDPDNGISSSYYRITKINGEVYSISNGVSEAEVPKHELQKIIYIDGYYIPEGKEKGSFEGYKCIIGVWDGNEDDHDIFYYFENEEELKIFQKTEGRIDTEFVVTKVS